MEPVIKEDKFSKSYKFFVQKELDSESFSIDDLSVATGWSKSTIKTYLSKKWDSLLENSGGRYFVKNVSQYSEREYAKMMSQVNKNSQDPFKPVLEIDVERLVVKAHESAMLAIDIYNRPATLFKSEGFIVMMIIAWTALLHAIFQKKGLKYTWEDKEGNDVFKDGELKSWELSKCASEYYGGKVNPVLENINFMIGIRNKVEHRFVPSIDAHIGGECQALLLNFDEVLTAEFGSYYALKESLAFPLQTSTLREDKKTQIIKRFQGEQYEEIKKYIDTYRDALSEETWNDPKYSFRVYLVPKMGNHKKSSDVAIEFVKFDPSKKEDMEAYKKQIILIKDRTIQVANQGKYKPSTVVGKIKTRINKPFSIHNHTQAVKYYQVRISPANCVTKYCQYDEVHNDYIYTDEWVDFLASKLSIEEEYNAVTSFKTSK